MLARAVEKALAKLKHARSHYASQRTHIERELAEVQRRLDRLVDALADGSLPAEELKTRLGAENARKTKLTGDLENLAKLAGLASLDLEQLKRGLQARIADVTALLGRHTVQARQMLRKLLAGKIELEPVGSGRERGYKFRGVLTIEKLIGGQTNLTHLAMVAPRGTTRPDWIIPLEGVFRVAA